MELMKRKLSNDVKLRGISSVSAFPRLPFEILAGTSSPLKKVNLSFKH
jgi:hypothetical protein